MKKPNIFQRIFGFVESVWDKIFNQFFRDGNAAVIAVNTLKKALEGNAADFIVSITPTSADNIALVWAKTHILPAIEAWMQSRKLVAEGATREEVVHHLLDYISSVTEDVKVDFLVRIAGDLAVYLSDGKLSIGEAIQLTQRIFKENHSESFQVKVLQEYGMTA